ALRSPLLPYTTLFRSVVDVRLALRHLRDVLGECGELARLGVRALEKQEVGDLLAVGPDARDTLLEHRTERLVEREVLVELQVLRSEEHTSELQSLRHL